MKIEIQPPEKRREVKAIVDGNAIYFKRNVDNSVLYINSYGLIQTAEGTWNKWIENAESMGRTFIYEGDSITLKF